MRPPGPTEPTTDREKFARLAGGTRIWAVGSLHGEADRLIREAMVGVAKGGPKPGQGESGVDTSA